MSRRKRRKRKKKVRRFPRLPELQGKVRHAEKILRLVYNRLYASRRIRLNNFNYDVYRTNRQAGKDKIAFTDLAFKLVKRNIDAALYLKILCRYGKYKNSTYMPRPAWLVKDKTIEQFAWLYRKERKSYDLHLDFKKAISGWSDLDIYSSIRDSGEMFASATKQGLTETEALLAIRQELSPWFIAVHTLKTDSQKDFRKCLEFLRRHQPVRRLAFKAYKRCFNGVS